MSLRVIVLNVKFKEYIDNGAYVQLRRLRDIRICIYKYEQSGYTNLIAEQMMCKSFLFFH